MLKLHYLSDQARKALNIPRESLDARSLSVATLSLDLDITACVRD